MLCSFKLVVDCYVYLVRVESNDLRSQQSVVKMKDLSTTLALLLVFCVVVPAVAPRRSRPCKFGDRIEYGHLGKEIMIEDLNAYIASPNHTESKGGVIVIQDIYGWQLSNTRAIVDMLSANNFTAILPDSFMGKPTWNRSNPWTEFGAFLAERPANGVGSVIDKCINYLKSSHGIRKIAMVGFCWGGRVVHYAMAKRDDISAGVSCYGLMADDDPDFGLINNPTLFIFGKEDRLFPPKEITTLRRALAKRTDKRKFSIRQYKGQGHGFVHRKLTSPVDPDKDEIYAARKKMIQWLNVHIDK